MKKYIKAAADADPLQDTIEILEDDFSYVLDGLDRLARVSGGKAALQIALELSDRLAEISDRISAELIA